MLKKKIGIGALVSVLSIFFFFVFVSNSLANEAEVVNRSQETVFPHFVSAPFTIDGYLNEAGWKEAVKLGSFLEHKGSGKLASVQTEVYLAYDNKNFYIGYLLPEPNIDKLKAKAKEKDDDVWQDDSVEIFLDSNYDKRTYYHFIINSSGVKQDERGQDAFWNGEWEAKTSKGKDCWICEIAIPFNSLEAPVEKGTIWGIGLGRGRYAGDEPQLSCWPQDRVFHSPTEFGTVIFGDYLSNLKLGLKKMRFEENLVTLKKDISGLAATALVDKTKKKIDDLEKEGKDYIKKIDSLKREVDDKTWTVLTLEGKTFSDRLNELKGEVQRNTLFAKEGYLVWKQNPWLTFSPNSLPKQEQLTDTIELTACINEYESGVFLITAPAEKEVKLSVKVEDLKSEGGIFPGEQVTLREVMLLEHKSMTGGKLSPDPLPPLAGEITIPAGQTKELWLTFCTKNVQAGEYKGKIILSSKDGKEKAVAIKLTVWPVELPGKLPIQCFAFENSSHAYYMEHLENYMKDMSEHYINTFYPMSSGYGGVVSPVYDEEGNLVKFSGNQEMLDKYLRMIKKYDGKILLRMEFDTPSTREFTLANSSRKLKLTYMSPAWQKLFRDWIKALVNHLKEMGFGYDDFLVNFYDEPPYAGREELYLQMAPLMRKVDPKVRLFINPVNSAKEENITNIASYVDVWGPAVMKLERNNDRQYLAILKTGKPMWVLGPWVDCQPLDDCYPFRLTPWWAWKRNVAGMAFWTYNLAGGQQDRSKWAEHAGLRVIYTGEDRPVTSRRWEGFREGCEDYLYLYLLDKEIKKAEKTEPAKKKEEILQAKKIMEEAVKEVTFHSQNPDLVYKYRAEIINEIIKLR